MQKITIRDILQRRFRYGGGGELEGAFGIYIVKDEEVVLYVGKSLDPIERLESHFGLLPHRSSGTELGMLYKDYPHEAQGWEIELYTLKECYPLVKKHFGIELQPNEPYDRSLELAELAMIYDCKPSLNVKHNKDASPLPAKYDRMPQHRLDNNAVDKLSFLAREEQP